MTLLAISSSLKTVAGDSDRSASRNLQAMAVAYLRKVVPVEPVDLRDIPLPFFAGTDLLANPCPRVQQLVSAIRAARGLLLAVPGYWGGMSGVCKNFLDLLGGADYDCRGGGSPLLIGKPVGLIVVGTDADTTQRAVEQAVATLTRLGARPITPVAACNNLRRSTPQAQQAAFHTLLGMTAALVTAAYAVQEGGCRHIAPSAA